MKDAWAEIERVAKECGAGMHAIRKWRARGVPAKWQIIISEADHEGRIDRAAFTQPPLAGRQECAAAS